jgi:hypothetical protein
VLGERRVRTLSALGSRLADSPDQAALVAEVAAVLGENAPTCRSPADLRRGRDAAGACARRR